MIEIIQTPTPTDTPEPTPVWVTPTPRPEVTVPFEFVTGEQIEGVFYTFTDDMVAGYNSVRDVMNFVAWFIFAAMVIVMVLTIMRRFKASE